MKPTSDPFQLHDQVAIVTGAGAGIGRAIAERFTRAGAKVAVSDLKAEAATAVAEGIKAAGGKAIGLACDVTHEESLIQLVEQTLGAFGKITLLVNNAGGGVQELG